LYDEMKPLSETAHERLSTIAANNELGAGMQIALRDLEIRGAGNLLGGEQSGHIAGVGFDLYLRMIGEAVSTFRGDVAEGQTELRLELPVDARIPDDYVESERLRLEAYQKLSTASAPTAADGQIELVLDELTDRYGEPPAEVHNLIAVSRLRRMAVKAGLSEVVAMGGNLRVGPAVLADSVQVRLQRMYKGSRYFTQTSTVAVPMPGAASSGGASSGGAFTSGDGEALDDTALIGWTRQLLVAIFGAEVAPAAPEVAP
jgi:transcription-repair coupling factor (superfamily II helicase)